MKTKETFELLEENAKERQVELRLKKDYDKPLKVNADRQKIEQVLINLFVNASHAMTIMRPPSIKEGGTLTVTCDFMSTRGFIEKSFPQLAEEKQCIRNSFLRAYAEFSSPLE